MFTRLNRTVFQLLCVLTLAFSMGTISHATEKINYFDVLYDTFNGLPTSEANDIVQTSDGTIWIASYSSLIQYDGRDFISYKDTLGLTSVLCLYIDSKDRLWIGTNNNGVVMYEDNEFHYLSETQDLPSFSTRSISELEDGTILVGTALGMYSITPDFTFEINTAEELQEVFVSELLTYDGDRTIGLTKAGDLFELKGTQLEYFLPVEDWEYDLPLSVLPIEDSFYIGTSGDYIVKMNSDLSQSTKESFDVIPTEGMKYINSMMVDSQDRIWIGADSGVGYIDHGTVVYLDYLTESQSCETVIEDFEGNFWIASSKSGVMKLNISMFQNISANLPTVVQFNAVELLDGYFYIASSSGIDIVRQSDLAVIENDFTEHYRGEYFRCVRKDQDGNLWFSSYTDDALIKYTPTTQEVKIFNADAGINYSRIRSTMTASDGKIWVATGDGIYVVENDIVIDYFGSEDGLQSLEILTLSESLDGRIFAGTDGAGVYVIEDGEVVEWISRKSGLHSDIILRTEADPINGGMWIVTGNSISFYDGNTGSIRTVENFPYGNNFDLMFFEDDMIVLCSIGVFVVSHESMMASLATGSDLDVQHFNHLNGLYSNAVANSFGTIEDGILYICGYQNLTAFNMNVEAIELDYTPPVEIPRIFINGEEKLPTYENKYILPSTANFIEFDIFIPTYALQDYSVSYQLKGYDEYIHTENYNDYNDPTYTNLPGGSYEFYVLLTDNRTGQELKSISYAIEKEHSFMENPVVQGLFIFVLFGAGFLIMRQIYKQREKKNQDIQQEKQKELAKMFHDTVKVLSNVIDAKDCYTNGHSQRVAFYTKCIAEALNFSEDEIDSAYVVALLHDVGKISIPDSVLNKPARLDDEEFEIMKTHAIRGGDILKGIDGRTDLVIGAEYHHERYDGKGYSSGLKGEEIPLIARIICVADAFDAMYSSRVYRKKMTLDYAISELEKYSGTQFDPGIVTVMVELIRSGIIDEQLIEYAQEDAIL
ncbi:MAG: HD domain-containing protein [Eubacteriales bacterium]